MSRSYPIWYDVTACKYKSDKSFGFRNTGEIEISIGSSGSNSHTFLKTSITRRDKVIEGKEYIVFKYFVDEMLIKTAIMESVKGNATNLIEIIYNYNTQK